MFQPHILSLFLYFPKDKSEYIPAAITFLIFFIGAIFAMKYIIAISKREAKKAKELEDRIMNQHNQKEQ
ncbi:hypothetical protein IEC97_09255 [Neobacillus cucumis]|uniref:hypothetical protein n=1 Tax=Neobacillus cucumis TaxID=1740721 RepID=UPI0018E00F8B|nr:hypothetical protein [Neobacillus cucumis]MBI0577547.1 hypothetical protein [Neobacillus cucumis]WHY91077.1 hypothetical protein QNK12_26125 [Neobacillus cucumis]